MEYNITKTVEEVDKLNLQGNIIPNSWWECELLKTESGKPNFLAIIILSDILYWYRSSQKRDEETGRLESINKKFAEDKLQKTYASWAEYFGVSKRQVKEACDFLVDRGIIIREFRDIQTKSGLMLNNVTYFEPVIEVIKEVTYPVSFLKDPPTKKRMRGYENSEEGVRNSVGDSYENSQDPLTEKRRTCTQNTTENNTENNTEITTYSFPHADAATPQSSAGLENLNDLPVLATISGNNALVVEQDSNPQPPHLALVKPESPPLPANLEKGYQSRELAKSLNLRFYEGNKYLRYFKDFGIQFWKTLDHRVKHSHVTKESLSLAFVELSKPQNYSVANFLNKLDYSVKEVAFAKLMDLIWVYKNGQCSDGLERKGAKTIAEWINKGLCTLEEVEDCILAIVSNKFFGNLTLQFVATKLAEFKHKAIVNEEGRYEIPDKKPFYENAAAREKRILQQQAEAASLPEEEKRRRDAELIRISQEKFGKKRK